MPWVARLFSLILRTALWVLSNRPEFIWGIIEECCQPLSRNLVTLWWMRFQACSCLEVGNVLFFDDLVSPSISTSFCSTRYGFIEFSIVRTDIYRLKKDSNGDPVA